MSWATSQTHMAFGWTALELELIWCMVSDVQRGLRRVPLWWPQVEEYLWYSCPCYVCICPLIWYSITCFSIKISVNRLDDIQKILLLLKYRTQWHCIHTGCNSHFLLQCFLLYHYYFHTTLCLSSFEVVHGKDFNSLKTSLKRNKYHISANHTGWPKKK